MGGEVGETNEMEKKMRIILTAGSVCVIPISISFPTVSQYHCMHACVCVLIVHVIISHSIGCVHVLDTKHTTSDRSNVSSQDTCI